MNLYMCYVDFQKAFNSVWRIGLWQKMRHLGYDSNMQLLVSLHGKLHNRLYCTGLSRG